MRRAVRRLFIAGGLFLLAALCTALLAAEYLRVQGTTIIVTNTNDSGPGSLRQAIADANDGDTIQFDPSLNKKTIGLTSGELAINKNITINGPGSDLLAVRASGLFRIFHIFSLHAVTINGLTISGGHSSGELGGGIFNGESTLTIRNCVVSDNFSDGNEGGGILSQGTLNLIRSTVRNNHSGFTFGFPIGSGGGIRASGNLTIDKSEIIDNTAAFDGGGILCFGTITIIDSTISGNQAGSGFEFSGYGAGILSGGTLEIRNSTISDNIAYGNQSGAGGGILTGWAENGPTTITNSTISGNSAYEVGGGIASGAPLTITHSTIIGNVAATGGGIYNSGSDAALELGNTILGGVPGANIVNNGGTVISHGYNLSSDDAGGFLTRPGDQINTNPLLGSLQNNGGPTFTHLPLAGSPVIDAGDPGFAPPPFTDQRAYLRVYNGRIDIGSLEVQTVPTPTPSPTPSATPTLTPFPTPILPPGGNGKIAFESLRSGTGSPDIWVMDADGANPINLTNTLSPFNQFAAWSPDGTKIAFSSNREGDYQIYVMNADGSNPIRVTSNEADNHEPRWSPDGGKFVFISTRDGNQEVYVMNVDGSNQIRLTNTPEVEIDPAWSPDGGKIAFESRRDGNYEIYVMNADGSNQTNITNQALPDHGPAWSPDGTRIAFHGVREDGSGIFLMSPDGSNVTRVTEPGGQNWSDGGSAWSPDGTKIAYHRTPNGGFADIWLVGADGSNPTNITHDSTLDIRPNWQRIEPPPTPTATVTATASPTPTATATTTATPSPSPTPAAQTLNLSTRMLVQTDDNVGIGGFIITGNSPKQILLRALGTSLQIEPVPLADPILELHGPPGFVTIIVDNCEPTADGSAGPLPTPCPCSLILPPHNPLEPCILATLDPRAYTAIVKGNNNGVGVSVLEIYDLDSPGGPSKLANISTRAFDGTGGDIMIAGLILGGNTGQDTIVMRGIGPSLSAFGIPNVLANPQLELRNSSGAIVRSNNDWMDDPKQAMLIQQAGLAPINNLESAIYETLEPGQYTALLFGVNNGTGVGLVEVYDLFANEPVPTPTPTPSGSPSPSPTPSPSASPSPSPGPCVENWDSVTAPALPAGWVATNPDPGDGTMWVTSTSSPDTPPNDAFIPDQDGTSDKVLDRLNVTINSPNAVLSFRNNYDTEFSNGIYWDGGLLEISSPNISGGDFLNIIDSHVGATCLSGCYTCEMGGNASLPTFFNAWCGDSGGYIDTVINLGPNLSGQTITLRWRFRSDEAVAAPGWRIDTLSITEATCP